MSLFLTSSVSDVIYDIVPKLGFDPQGKRLVFIKTAAEDLGERNPEWLEVDRQAFKDQGFEVVDYTFSNKTEEQLIEDLEKYDLIFVSGGNTFYLLQEAQKCNAGKVIRKLVEAGKPYIGSSAGSVICGPNIEIVSNLDDPKIAKDLQGTEGFGLVDFIILPHWGSGYFRRLYLEDEMEHAYTLHYKIILLNDKQYVEVREDWYRIIEV